MDKWEYRRAGSDGDTLIEDLNELGREGWELVYLHAYYTRHNPDQTHTNVYTMVLKRKINDV